MNAPVPDSLHLKTLLDSFRVSYGGMRVAAEPIDLTDCFWSDDAGRYVAPRSYGELPESCVLGYVALGGALISKFQKDAEGRVLRENGMPVIADFLMEQQVMSCLCLHDLRNTSLYEIGDALEGTHRIQGYRRWHLRKFTAAICQRYPGFSPLTDSCFLFADGEKQVLENRIALNALWLAGLVREGAQFLNMMTAQEAALMAQIFPLPVLAGDADAIRSRSYMFGRPLWEPLSALYLDRKVAVRKAFLAGGG